MNHDVEKGLAAFTDNCRDESHQTNEPAENTDPVAVPATPTTVSNESTVSGGSRSPLGS